jgi:hypothetical protein
MGDSDTALGLPLLLLLLVTDVSMLRAVEVVVEVAVSVLRESEDTAGVLDEERRSSCRAASSSSLSGASVLSSALP